MEALFSIIGKTGKEGEGIMDHSDAARRISRGSKRFVIEGQEMSFDILSCDDGIPYQAVVRNPPFIVRCELAQVPPVG